MPRARTPSRTDAIARPSTKKGATLNGPDPKFETVLGREVPLTRITAGCHGLLQAMIGFWQKQEILHGMGTFIFARMARLRKS